MSESQTYRSDEDSPRLSDSDRLRHFRERFATEELLPLEQGVLFNEVFKMQNPTTGRRYTLREGAALLGVNVGRFRSFAALCRPYVVPKDVEAERAKIRAILDSRSETTLSWEGRLPVKETRDNGNHRP